MSNSRFTLLISSLCAISAWAVPPTIHTNNSFDEPILYRAISDNGEWAVAETRPDYDGGKVIHLTDYSYVTVTCKGERGYSGRPLDITDDGNIAVGAYGDPARPEPAIWDRATGRWKLLPYPDKRFNGGYAHAVTPDGHWAVGRIFGAENVWTEAPALWDLYTGEYIQLPNLPEPQLDYYNQNPNRFTAISADGRYITAILSPGGAVLYDRESEKYYSPQGKLADGSSVRVSASAMSPSGRYIYGRAHLSGSATTDGDSYSSEGVYDMLDGSVKMLRESGLSDMMIWGVADDGTLYAGAGGNGTPMRDFQIYSNGYWYPLDQVLWQGYGIDYYQQTGLSNTGTPYAFSADGQTFASFTDPNRGEGWVIKFAEPIADVCSRVDLMASYEVAPSAGARISSLTTMRIGFDRDIALAGNPKDIELIDGDGQHLAWALDGTVNRNIFTLSFRHIKQGDGDKYCIVIPAGMLQMALLPSISNQQITVEYLGRNDTPVSPAANTPAEYTLRALDYSTSYLDITFDSELALTDTPMATLCRAENGEKVASLSLAVKGNHLLIYSPSIIPLYRYSDYTVQLHSGSVSDPGGSTGSYNEEMSFLIHGNMLEEPEDDNILMSEDFDCGLGNKFMFYEGDGLMPSPAMQAWGFTADTTPWWIARDDIYSTDYAAVSHSSYINGTGSNDWMVIRRLYIPDNTCRLLFDSQCYMHDMDDHLKVYAIPSDVIYSAITPAAMEHFMTHRELIYDKVQTPGSQTEVLDGDWLHNDVSLAQYAGQYIYIAFVNDNTAGSAIFVDNVSVTRDLTFSMAMLSPQSVVAKQDQPISVRLYVGSEALSFEEVELRLLDTDDNLVSTFTSAPGTIIDYEHPMEATFSTPLSLQPGCSNHFSVEVTAADIHTRFDRVVKNLLFSTTKHAVLEEYSGGSCPNCPDGIVIMDKLRQDFGSQFIPLTIRSYMGDELTPANSDYASLLGLDALGAPSGTVNRRYGGYPISRASDGTLSYCTGTPEDGLWYDFVASELSTPSDADISATATADTGTGLVSVQASLRYALDCENIDHSIVAVLLEDGVTTYQQNGRCDSTDPLLGPWGRGGEYGTDIVYPYICDDVVRNVSHTNLCGMPGMIPATLTAGQSVDVPLSIEIPRRQIALENCKVALLLIDNMTGYIENAALAPITDITSSSEIDDDTLHISYGPSSIRVRTTSENACISLYSGIGIRVGSAQGPDVTFDTPAGLYIISVETPTHQVVKKVMVP